MNIFFDLDGTIIDSKMRLFLLFNFLVPNSKYSYDEYWNLKQNKISHKEILKNYYGYSENQFMTFQEKWMNEIEKDNWLQFDKPIIGAKNTLISLTKKYSLFLVTARQSKLTLIRQLQELGLFNIFKMILVTEQKIEKYDLIINNVEVSKEDWIIGDTGKDIETGKKLGINTIAVLSGFLNKERLDAYKPDHILNNIIELDAILKNENC